MPVTPSQLRERSNEGLRPLRQTRPRFCLCLYALLLYGGQFIILDFDQALEFVNGALGRDQLVRQCNIFLG